MRGRYLFGLFVAGVFIGVAFFVLTTDLRSPDERHQQTKSLSNAKQLATACKLYAIDNEGKFPARLADLAPDYIFDLEGFRYLGDGHGEKSRPFRDWLYFGAGFQDTDPLPVLIASPQPADIKSQNAHRIVIAFDTSGMVVREAEYQKRLANTMERMRALEDARRPAASPAPATKPPDNGSD
jgi:hypothetical protein